jgi:hypothetical protein
MGKGQMSISSRMIDRKYSFKTDLIKTDRCRCCKDFEELGLGLCFFCSTSCGPLGCIKS